eukprot:6484831-Amphidinium_carterae.1
MVLETLLSGAASGRPNGRGGPSALQADTRKRHATRAKHPGRSSPGKLQQTRCVKTHAASRQRRNRVRYCCVTVRDDLPAHESQLNLLAKSPAEVESTVLAMLEHFKIVRPFLLYGRRNHLSKFLCLLTARGFSFD